MKPIAEIIKSPNLLIKRLDKKNEFGMGFLYFNGLKKEPMTVVFSWNDSWDHVSVAYKGRCPTWDEMCRVKDMFFQPEETVVQYHPAQSDYINVHPYCLHMWRPQNIEIPKPPKEFV